LARSRAFALRKTNEYEAKEKKRNSLELMYPNQFEAAGKK